MKTKDKKESNHPKNTNKHTGTGKGNLKDKNPMVAGKERSAQTNNLGKYGEGPKDGIMAESDAEDIEEEQKRKDKLIEAKDKKNKQETEDTSKNKKSDAEEMYESDAEIFEDEGYKRERKD